MKKQFHKTITRESLKTWFSEDSLLIIIKANVRQDRIRNQFGHDEIHFDGSAFTEGFNYIQDQRALLIEQIKEENYIEAQKALGRLLHTWQDFYSHSNYVQLWFDRNKGIPFHQIDHDDQDIFNSPNLRSGKNYGLLELACMIPPISYLIKPLMPEDSHAKMNLDSPENDRMFPYAYEAARKKTEAEFLDIYNKIKTENISHHRIQKFLGQHV